MTIDPKRNDWRLDQCDRHTETITVTVPPNGTTPKADVYLLADTTFSMYPVIEAVKAGAGAILGDPALAAFDVAWGVGNYRDFPVPTPNSYAFAHQQSPTTDHTAAATAIGAWTAAEGSDISEGQLYALHEVATNPSIGWRPDSKRIVVWFGDAPGHDPICTDLSGLAAAITEASATADLTGADITVVAVSTTTGSSPTPSTATRTPSPATTARAPPPAAPARRPGSPRRPEARTRPGSTRRTSSRPSRPSSRRPSRPRATCTSRRPATPPSSSSPSPRPVATVRWPATRRTP